MHILVLPSWYPSSYNSLSGIFFKEQAEALAKFGHKVSVISIQEIGLNEILQDKKMPNFYRKGIENNVYTYTMEYPNFIRIKKFRMQLKKILFQKIFKKYIERDGLPNIVHLHSFGNGEFAIWIKKNYNIPYVVTEHSTDFARKNLSIEALKKASNIFKYSSYSIAVSKQFKELLENKFNQKFSYIPNIVNMDIFSLKHELLKDTFNFICIGFLNKKKNHKMLIKAFTKVFKNQKNITLSIVGSGSEYTQLESLITKLDMQNQIFLKGSMARDCVVRILQESDAFVLSSQYETFGVVIIEAMACGLPVVSTKSGGPESIIALKELGLLCNITEDSLSQALRELYTNRLQYNPVFIRAYAEQHFSEQAVCMQLNEIYKQSISYE